MKLIYFLFLFIFISSCSGSESNDIHTDSGTVMQSEDPDTCLCNDLVIDSSGQYLLNDTLYTGICVEYYPMTESKYIEKHILKGLIHGRVRYFDRSGEILYEELYEEGNKKRFGELESIRCKCDELKSVESKTLEGKKRKLLDGIPFTGVCEAYYPEGDQIYMELNYKIGLLDGKSTFYNKDGSIMYIENYDKGELIKTMF